MHLLRLKFSWSLNLHIVSNHGFCNDLHLLWGEASLMRGCNYYICVYDVKIYNSKKYAGLVRCNISFLKTVYAWPNYTKSWVVFYLVVGFPLCWLNLQSNEIIVGCYWHVNTTYCTFRLILSCPLLLDCRKQIKGRIQLTLSDFSFLSVWCPQQ